jgi:pimeloyl-ACP methyl ester carboxylesterase
VLDRYYGFSQPFPTLSTANLQYLTLENTIQDHIYFAREGLKSSPNTELGNNTADVAPWVFVGGSYGGSLALWTEDLYPGTFHAYHASSAPVEAIWDYWTYFNAARDHMPKNCSADIQKVIEYVDNVLTTGTAQEQLDLKKMFDLQDLQNDDFAAVLSFGPALWQNIQLFSGYETFSRFCDTIEGVAHPMSPDTAESTAPGPEGVGMPRALAGYVEALTYYFLRTDLPNSRCRGFGYASRTTTECWDSHNSNNLAFTDLSSRNYANRQWWWFLCNEPFGWWQSGAPPNQPTIVSRLVTDEYWTRQCNKYFPPENGVNFGATPGRVASVRASTFNARTGGWNDTVGRRVSITNGEFDPWRSASLSSDQRPGGRVTSVEGGLIQVISNGGHCTDMLMENTYASAEVGVVVARAAQTIALWVREWYTERGLGLP